MSTKPTYRASLKYISAAVAVMAAVVTGLLLLPGTMNTTQTSTTEALDDDDVAASALPVSVKVPPNSIVASLGAHSFLPNSRASLRLVSPPPGRITLQFYRAGAGNEGRMHGKAVSNRWTALAGSELDVSIGNWPSGLYYLRLSTSSGLLGYATFVLRPRRLGKNRVVVVLPTNTWQAYNFYDADQDGKPDSWYANPDAHTVDLTRPFIKRGVPPHYEGYDDGFQRWLAKTGKRVDFLGDDDLEQIESGDTLLAAYDLIVFSGHEEYVTPHVYDIVTQYRDRGGNLAFLSANNFFYRVWRRGDLIERDGRWRDLGRPEARLVGSQYVNWYQEKYENRPYLVADTKRASWVFSGTSLRKGSQFGKYGIEIDAPTPDSPPGTRTLATIPDIFGPGQSAAMTYYETPAGAKVFDAGVMNFGGTAMWPQVSPLVANLWARLSKP
jgi:hypothetical protein